MQIPDNLHIYIRGGVLWLTSGTHIVELKIGGRVGVFAGGPLSWREVQVRYLEPALAQFSRAGVAQQEKAEP